MELVALNKPALMIPTPGQTEQEYLARHYEATSLFYTAQQNGLDLLIELNKIQLPTQPSLDHIPINDIKAFRDILSH